MGEVTQSDHVLKIKDLTIRQTDLTIVLRFASAKNNRTGEFGHVVTVQPRPGSRWCPMKALLQYLEMQPEGPRVSNQLYTQKTGSPLSQNQVRSVLGKLQSVLGWGKNYSLHSFSMGCATDLFVGGTPVHCIQKKGRWR